MQGSGAVFPAIRCLTGMFSASAHLIPSMSKSRFIRSIHCGLFVAFCVTETGLNAAAAENAAAPAAAQAAPPASPGQGEVSPGGGRRGGGRRGQGGGAGAPNAEQAATQGGAGAGAAQSGGGQGSTRGPGGGSGQGGGGAGQGASAGGAQKAGGGAAGGGRAGGRGGRGGNTVQPVEVVKLTRADLIDSITIVGSIAANESSTIRPEISGIVKEIFFNEGQAVRKGDVLLRLDDNELRAQYNQAESSFRIANLTLDRIQALAKASTASQSEVDKAQADFASAKANLDLLTVRLARTEIKAPFDGVVNSRSLSPGDFITAQTVISTIDDLSRLKMDFQVAERYQDKVKVGNPFTVRVSGGGTPLEGKGEVYFVSSTIDRNSRSVQVKGLLAPAGNQPLRPGMFANIELVLEVRKGVLTVPEGAILSTTSGAQVVAVANRDGQSVAQFVDVKIGLRARGLVEISAVRPGDLSEGQSIVGSGVGGLQLFNGGRLEPRPLNPAFQGGN
jgi:membrane fusion protein (multidrug efflux system)